MIIVCSNCGQNMEGTPDLLEKEIQCPACMRWAYPQLPRATGAVRPEEAGQSRLNELADAAEELEAWSNRRNNRAVRPPQPVTPPQPAQEGWYVLTASGPQGPFSNKQIMQFARAGKINAANRLRRASNGTELRAGDIPNLFGAPPATTGKPATGGKDGWYIRTSKGNVGPFANAKVVALAKAGKISAKTMLRYGNDGQFVAAGTVRGLIPSTT
jgi:hypothetical protein